MLKRLQYGAPATAPHVGSPALRWRVERPDVPAVGARRRRIHIVGINYSPEVAGIGPYTASLADAVRRGGIDVAVVTGIPHYPQWRIQGEQYLAGTRWIERIDGVPVTRVRHHVPQRADLPGRMQMELSFFARACWHVAQVPSDALIAVTPSLSAAAAALLAARGRPVGIIVQDLTGVGALESGSAGRGLSAVLNHVELAILRRAALVGVIAPGFGSSLVGSGLDPNAIASVANFTRVEPVDVSKREARLRLGWPEAGTTVVHTGNLGMKQGLESVLAAARLALERGSDVTFVLVGAGNQRASLESQARGLASVRFVEPVAEAEYPYVLAAADLLLINERPGVRDMSLPSKLASYVAAGRPIVAAVEPGGITHSLLARSGASALVRPGRADDLLLAVESIAHDGLRQSELVRAASALWTSEYKREAASKRYVEFAERLLELV